MRSSFQVTCLSVHIRLDNTIFALFSVSQSISMRKFMLFIRCYGDDKETFHHDRVNSEKEKKEKLKKVN